MYSYQLGEWLGGAKVHRLIDIDAEAVRRVVDLVTHEDLAEVLGALLDTSRGLAVRKAVVAEGQLGLDGCERVDLSRNLFAWFVGVHESAREVEGVDNGLQAEENDQQGGRDPPGRRHRGRHGGNKLL